MPFVKGKSGNPTGRKKGTQNKITTEVRRLLALAAHSQVRELNTMINETRYGIEIEKTMPGPDGKPVTVLGRLNADPGKAADLTLRMMKFFTPEMGRVEHTGEDGEPLVINVVTLKGDE